jgi:hypothetical protein
MWRFGDVAIWRFGDLVDEKMKSPCGMVLHGDFFYLVMSKLLLSL